MLPRREFLGAVAGVSVTLAATSAQAQSKAIPGGSALVESASDFDLAAFNKIVSKPVPYKVVWDLTKIGKAFGNVKNALDGYHFGFNFGPGQTHMVMALDGPANTANFSDEMWEKYRLGEWLKIDDPKSGKPATRNIWLHGSSNGSTDQQDEKSIYQDASIEGLQRRNVSFFT